MATTASSLMRVLWLNEQHGLDFAELPIPEPVKGEFLVRVSCSPVTPFDLMVYIATFIWLIIISF